MENAKGLAEAMGYTLGELFIVSDQKKTAFPKTILEHYRLISMIMAQAEKEMLVSYNVASKATQPRVKRKEADYFQPEEMEDILKALQKVPLKWKAMPPQPPRRTFTLTRWPKPAQRPEKSEPVCLPH